MKKQERQLLRDIRGRH